MKYLNSFDVFDTCLIRKCGSPENVFNILSHDVFVKEVGEQERQEFVARRKAAQNSLFERKDYDLKDIYDAFLPGHLMLRSKEELVQLELACEEKMLLPVVKIQNIISNLHHNGERVIFISDMYLPHSFILSILKKYNLFQEGDKLYVSNQEGCLKSTGELYRLVSLKENISFTKWMHWGDNKKSDYEIPKKLGIKCHHVEHSYSPYPNQWIKNSHSLCFDYAGIIAGLSRSFQDDTPMKDLDVDIIAPFYCSFIHRVMSDAVKHNIQRLYFCARDTFQLYQIAQIMKPLFPSLELKYLYISKKSLYDGDNVAKIKYFEQEGLATTYDKVAIVDLRSTGHTLYYLNQLFKEKHYNKIRGYYFELYTDYKVSFNLDDYYCELNKAAHYNEKRLRGMTSCWHLYESFFSMNNQKRTIDYEIKNGIVYPVFAGKDVGDEQCLMKEESLYSYHTELLCNYAKSYIDLKLINYNNKIFEEIAIPTLISFFRFPEKHYLPPLKYFYGYHSTIQQFIPYIKQESIVSLLMTKGRDSMWRKGTFAISLPNNISKLLGRIILCKRH